jgi:hypothetical protein
VTTLFTEEEQSEKKYTVKQAVDAAKARLGAVGIGKFVFTDRRIRNRSMAERITLAELNALSEELFIDSTC